MRKKGYARNSTYIPLIAKYSYIGRVIDVLQAPRNDPHISTWSDIKNIAKKVHLRHRYRFASICKPRNSPYSCSLIPEMDTRVHAMIVDFSLG